MSQQVSCLGSLVPAQNPRKKSNGRVSAQPQNDKTRKVQTMSKIKSTKQFKEQVDAAFATMQTRDEAKACYEFQREEYKTAEAELCAYASEHREVFEGTEGDSGWGSTDTVEYVMSGGVTVERADGGKLTDREFLQGLPRKYIRVKFELNKAKLKADGLDDNALSALGLVRVGTLGLKLKAKAA